jgi:hypothetical protein
MALSAGQRLLAAGHLFEPSLGVQPPPNHMNGRSRRAHAPAQRLIGGAPATADSARSGLVGVCIGQHATSLHSVATAAG